MQSTLTEEKEKTLPLFAGLCFFLSLVDILFPKPLPFFRLGLANIALMLAMDVLSARSFFLLLIVKVLGQAIISGTLFSYVLLFSLLGTFSSGVVMYLTNYLRKWRIISFIGISMLGALASNMAQLFLARFMVFGEGTYLILPPLLLISLVTSFILGVFANSFYVSSLWYEGLLTGEIEIKTHVVRETKNELKNLYRIVVGVFLIMLLISVDIVAIKAVVFCVAIILCIVDKIKINGIRLLLSVFCIIAINLFPPYGNILFQYHIFNTVPIIITQDALFQGILKALLFEGLLYTSKWMLKTHLRFHGSIGKVVNNSIFVFERLLSCKKEIRINNLIGSLDSVLLSIDKII